MDSRHPPPPAERLCYSLASSYGRRKGPHPAETLSRVGFRFFWRFVWFVFVKAEHPTTTAHRQSIPREKFGRLYRLAYPHCTEKNLQHDIKPEHANSWVVYKDAEGEILVAMHIRVDGLVWLLAHPAKTSHNASVTAGDSSSHSARRHWGVSVTHRTCNGLLDQVPVNASTGKVRTKALSTLRFCRKAS
jgi:hypothetical protein